MQNLSALIERIRNLVPCLRWVSNNLEGWGWVLAGGALNEVRHILSCPCPALAYHHQAHSQLACSKAATLACVGWHFVASKA